jgi:hypothetical protein
MGEIKATKLKPGTVHGSLVRHTHVALFMVIRGAAMDLSSLHLFSSGEINFYTPGHYFAQTMSSSK